MISDWIMAIAALVFAISCVAVIAVFVPDLDLIAVIVIVSALAVWDFWSSLSENYKEE